ncbi:cold shock domain-containing protein [Candidatus Falkowbacteria bacterium]|nr:cold shock domain-containing protein [Candidatus Falkowbacteria bacterium]
MNGKIKTLTGKGFGFITSEDNPDKDLFFHTSGLNGVAFDQLQEGDAVTFDVEQSDKGPRAVNVTRV